MTPPKQKTWRDVIPAVLVAACIFLLLTAAVFALAGTPTTIVGWLLVDAGVVAAAFVAGAIGVGVYDA